MCWNKWWTFTFTGAKEQLWLQVWLHFIKQFPMHCFFFPTCIVTYPCHCGVIRNISNETDVFTHSSVQQECVWLCIPFSPPILRQTCATCFHNVIVHSSVGNSVRFLMSNLQRALCLWDSIIRNLWTVFISINNTNINFSLYNQLHSHSASFYTCLKTFEEQHKYPIPECI